MTVGVEAGRDLAEMSVDEFLEKGLSSSSESELDDGKKLTSWQHYTESMQPKLKKRLADTALSVCVVLVAMLMADLLTCLLNML